MFATVVVSIGHSAGRVAAYVAATAHANNDKNSAARVSCCHNANPCVSARAPSMIRPPGKERIQNLTFPLMSRHCLISHCICQIRDVSTLRQLDNPDVLPLKEGQWLGAESNRRHVDF